MQLKHRIELYAAITFIVPVWGLIGYAIYATRNQIAQVAPILLYVVSGSFLVLTIGGAVFGLMMLHAMWERYRIHTHLFHPNASNVYPAYLDKSSSEFLQPENGQLPYPDHYSLHVDSKPAAQITGTKVEEAAAPSLPGPCQFSDVLGSGFEPTLERIFLGYLPGNKPIFSTLEGLCHVANAGATGGGKSSNIRLIVSQLCYLGADVLLLNPHYTQYDRRSKEDWTPIENCLFRKPVTNFHNIKKWLQWAATTELRKRIERYNNSQDWGHPLFIVMDELPAIAKHVPEAFGWMADILREGRKVDLYLITAAQDFLVKTIGGSGAVRDCFRTAIYVGGDAQTARVLLDVKGTVDDGSLGQGVVMIRSSQVKQAKLARVPYVDNQALFDLLGPSTYQPEKVVDADPDTDELDSVLFEEMQNNVLNFPASQPERAKPTLAEAIVAWNGGAQSIRTMQDALGCNFNQARDLIDQVKQGMRGQERQGV